MATNKYSANPAKTAAEKEARQIALGMSQSSAQEERDRISNAQRTAAQLEAAATGDYSKLLQGVDRRDQRDVISQADRVLSTLRGDYERLRRSSDEYKDQAGQDRYMRSQLAKYTDVDVDALIAGTSDDTDTTDTITTDTVTTNTGTPGTVATNTGTPGTGTPVLTDTSLTDSPSPGGGTSLQDTAFVDTTVNRPAIVETTPSTEIVELQPDEVAPIVQSTPKTVVQQVAPVTQTQTPQATPFVMPGSVPQTGTVATPVQTAGLSAVPGQVTYKTSYAGTAGAVPQTILTSTPGSGEQIASGYQQVQYINPQTNQTIIVTEFNGNPVTYIPPGFVRQTPMAEQQTVEQPIPTPQSTSSNTLVNPPVPTDLNTEGVGEGIGQILPGIMGMSPGGDVTLARKFLGFPEDAPDNQLDNFLQSSPAAAARMGKYRQAMMNMGGMRMGAVSGTLVNTVASAIPKIINQNATPKGAPATTPTPAPVVNNPLAQQSANLVGQTMQPIQAPIAGIQPTPAEFIPTDAGMTVPMAPFAQAATTGTTQQAPMPTVTPTATMTPATAATGVQAATSALQPAQGTLSEQAQVGAAQQATTSVTGMEAAQGAAIKVEGPTARKLETDPVTGESEIISGSANAETAAAFTEAKEAEEATPSKQATVQGQLEGLMAQFEGGNTPAWAAGAMRSATNAMISRGLGASSIAGQAIVQAAMESAIPIAQIDAATQAQFEAQNLSNRQQRAMLAAQQRAQFIGQEFDQAFQARVQNAAKISDVANMNFTAEQQIALEDSRAANTVNLNNLSNRQAMVMAEAAALSQLDMANLSNRQQAAVQNAANFLQMDMANLSNRQQTEVFKAQQNIQALFTDQAAENAAEQFNAANQNQTDQFFANLASQTSQFNAVQANAMDQFNVNSVNALREFNSQIQQQRDLFNAQNGLVIAQANAQWRQNLATLNTAAQNESNMAFAQTINALTSTNLDAIWQRERDIMSMAFQVSEGNADRANSIILQKMAADAEIDVAELQAKIGAAQSKGNFFAELVKTVLPF
jgi:hypothetical protein